uniref:Uncharacterized protein n=1 Tax=Chromera velia CCMP2878 TaxID=1169474 RepID=A0A0G4F956_9ALVE|eukprot:Cvel_15816.t1-p1 / transcript=Cvel_15816.t1 / gene=Cvel_15816 / organism=Chromera_velia_CCMP2878 / gene_product=hypothetical protein / transcript_product=hypothetical protein / location=Cvel_scaffold1188:10223-10765(-) / protein_length=181 / sequence_SO=supercontig / SO=protein_coding / is_pseudo=false
METKANIFANNGPSTYPTPYPDYPNQMPIPHSFSSQAKTHIQAAMNIDTQAEEGATAWRENLSEVTTLTTTIKSETEKEETHQYNPFAPQSPHPVFQQPDINPDVLPHVIKQEDIKQEEVAAQKKANRVIKGRERLVESIKDKVQRRKNPAYRCIRYPVDSRTWAVTKVKVTMEKIRRARQ